MVLRVEQQAQAFTFQRLMENRTSVLVTLTPKSSES